MYGRSICLSGLVSCFQLEGKFLLQELFHLLLYDDLFSDTSS